MHKASQYTGLVIVVVVMIVIVTTIVVVVVVALAVAVAGDVIAMRAADAVHAIQHARKNALRHINKYQPRALAN
jgi:sensor c-di-GMP phosphodiesterase-like protein